jgi:thioredoxin 1
MLPKRLQSCKIILQYLFISKAEQLFRLFKTQKIMTKVITASNFDEVVLQSEQPVMVDFWAQWCGPCKIIGPIIEEIHSEYEGKAAVGKVDVDQQQELATRFGIRNIPTILFFKNGQLVDKITGAAPKREFTNKLDRLL